MDEARNVRTLAGRVALVTGGSRGIGFAIAQRLGASGAGVAIAARDEATLRSAERRLREAGIDARGFSADVSEEPEVVRLVGAVESELGSIDVLVANAGGGTGAKARAHELAVETWQGTLAGNLTSTFLCVREALPGMLARRWGRIITMSSRAAVGGGVLTEAGPRAVEYAAAKAGVIAFTQALALEVAGTGVTANVIAPGPIATEQFLERRGRQAIEAIAAQIPVGRLGTPDDVAHAVLFLATDPGFVTGQTIHVNGGTWVG